MYLIIKIVLILSLSITRLSLAQQLFEPLRENSLNGQSSSSFANPVRSSYGQRSNNKIVHVYGAVELPGVYSLMSSDRLSQAILMAGGISKNGSDRRVELRRNGKLLVRVDLLELRSSGDLKNNPFLQNDDVIFVPVKNTVVSLQGPVKVPGIFEIVEEKNLYDLIYKIGQGLLSGAATKGSISVIRFDEKGAKSVNEVKIIDSDLKAYELKNGDIVQVPHLFGLGKHFSYSVGQLPYDNLTFPSYTDKVFIVGGVRLPQAITYHPSHTLNSYVSIAGGLTRLGRKDIKIRRLDGSTVKSKLGRSVSISPGDTIDVGENKLGPEFWITLMTTLASIGITSYAIFDSR